MAGGERVERGGNGTPRVLELCNKGRDKAESYLDGVTRVAGGTLLRDTGGREGAGAGKIDDYERFWIMANTKRLEDARNDAVQLQHEVITLLPTASSILQLLLLVVTVRIKQARPDRMRTRSFPAYLLN